MNNYLSIWQKTKFYLVNTLEMMAFVGGSSAADVERQKMMKLEGKHHPPHCCRDNGSG